MHKQLEISSKQQTYELIIICKISEVNTSQVITNNDFMFIKTRNKKDTYK
jgi:hypothetical protein